MSDQRRVLTAGVALLERAIDYALGSLRIVSPAALCRPTPCAAWNLQQLLHHLGDSLDTLNEAALGQVTAAPLDVGVRGAVPRAVDPRGAVSGAVDPRGAVSGAVDPRGAMPRAADPGDAGVAEVRGDAGMAQVRGDTTAGGCAGGRSAGSRTMAVPARTQEHPPHLPLRNPALTLRDTATEVLGRWAAVLTGDLITIHDRHLTSPMVAAVGAIEVAAHAWDVARACGEHHPIPPLLAEELLDLAHLFVTGADRPARFGPAVRLPMGAPAQDHLLAHLGRHPAWPAVN
ncbi:DinB family protein [Nonomuraea gerenzanensis]|uniref:Mycothiol-dependent maleylpyruvate isomerase metal-binding domain-containing protein n=1 Tax=Nonomuraea gerenzanensis TaxID=93944 RepID=A0A1M4E1U5_9ACTN|nr:hypothetical protein [Nonomuraea gerenzanensis]UBU15030.1 hypothetical protein LCN96_08410 [Nonomuraea gerenzanensis]SBO92772.1 hypothetical protein BN4615_P2286 [Nonomuraea gerenzanensis]